MNPLPQFENLTIKDSVIDDVIANLSSAFQVAGVEESTLEHLKQVWRFKIQRSLQVNPTDQVPNKATEPGQQVDGLHV